MANLGERTIEAVRSVFGDDVSVGSASPIDHGRGVFSHVMRAELGGAPTSSVAVKLLRSDANGAAALTSGAVAREILAYEELLPATPAVAAPELFGVSVDSRNMPALVLEDLSSHRHADQVSGLGGDDLRAVVAELIELHSAWADHPELHEIAVRHSTPAHLPEDGLLRGAELLDTKWAAVSAERRSALQALASHHREAVGAFGAEDASTLCHGDPRGDNVAFDSNGRAVLIDWQQIAVQFGEADLAWLLATSVDRDNRRSIEGDIVASYGLARRQDAATTWRRYVTGMILPGLAVLLLAQRSVDDERTERFVRTSIERIADAVIDLRVTETIIGH